MASNPVFLIAKVMDILKNREFSWKAMDRSGKIYERKHVEMLNIVDKPMTISFCLLIHKALPYFFGFLCLKEVLCFWNFKTRVQTYTHFCGSPLKEDIRGDNFMFSSISIRCQSHLEKV